MHHQGEVQMRLRNITWIPAQLSLPGSVPDMQRLPVNCVRKAIISLVKGGIMA